VQVDHIKPTMKAPGTKHLKLKYYELLSNVAFKLCFRRYIEGTMAKAWRTWYANFSELKRMGNILKRALKVGWCRLTVSKLELKARLVSGLAT